MIGLRSGIAGLMAFGAALPAAAGDEPSGLEPYQIVRSLELVQDRLAGGDHAAQPMQRKLLEMIDSRFATREGSQFENELNRRALLVYAMSGGNPVTVEAALAHLGRDDPNRKLGESILFYVNGKPDKALDAFASVDPTAYTQDIAMYLALVKGSMLSKAEPKEALALLDRARLLAPGTLVEEAALRRSMAVATTLGDAVRFVRLSEQYVRTYLRSPYAAQFADAFVAGVVALHENVDRKAVIDIAALMEPEQEKVIYLRIARRAAIDGLIELAAFAASRAEGLEDDPRADLYAGLSSVTSGAAEDVLGKLSRIDRDRLSENDRQLLDAARAIATGMTAAPSEPNTVEAQPGRAEVRVVGPEPAITEEMTDRAAGRQEPTPHPAEPDTTPVAAIPIAVTSRSGDAGIDAAVDRAEAMVAATRAKLADIDKLIGAMPE
ncbi:chemotaxis protein MotC [Mesorhizobium sp. KR9-304]|uniref:chemotaxis protein MotC n=1 Tax=Mesorhizobium sp. KR9-304 TaxID=3156614 RepID=UPI0032B34F70